MSRSKNIKRPVGFPKEKDFDPYGGCLDAQTAWKNFGEMSLDQARELFDSNALIYQEDFMFMGWRAFVYYFPVLDSYLKTVRSDDPYDDCAAAIIGSGVSSQLEEHRERFPKQVRDEIADLKAFVLENVTRYTPDEKEQRRILREWKKIDLRDGGG